MGEITITLADTFLSYAKYYNFGKAQKLKLADVLQGDLKEQEYYQLCIALALKGYELRLIKGSSKQKIKIGGTAYSYFQLIPSELLQELEQLKQSKHPKAGQKSLSDKSTITLVYDLYLKGQSLAQIADSLNASGYKTKRGGQWYKSTVKFILQNHQYVEAGLVSEDAFEEIQEKLKEKRLWNKDK